MDTINIRGLKVETIIGVHAWEKKLPRPLVIDIELATDVARAARSDSMKDALDYQAVAEATMKFAGASRFQLVETLGEKLAALLQKEFGVGWVRISVHKPGAVAGVQDVSVTLERGKKGARVEFPP